MRCLALSLCFAAASCVPTPESYPAPEQQPQITGPERVAYDEEFLAADPNSEGYVISQIMAYEGGGGKWRWTGPKPEMRFQLLSTEKRKLRVEFVINPMTFKHTGPVTIGFYINGTQLTSEVYSTHGRHIFERPVPKQYLRVDENRVALDIRETWESEPGVKLGVLLEQVSLKGE